MSAHPSRPGRTRRQLLVDGVRVSALLPVLPSLASGLLSGADAEGERVLVVVQLGGGNDALNTLVPHRQDAYFRLRPSIALPRGGLHRLDDDHGLHPELGGLAQLFGEGRATAIHGVGYPSPDRSHFRSMEIWHTADPDHPPGDTGWLGRLADQIQRRAPGSMAALHVGAGDLPLALRGLETFTPSVHDAAGFRTRPIGVGGGGGGGGGFERHRDALLAPADAAGAAEPDLAFLRTAARGAYDAARRMSELAERETPVDYPGTDLGRRLRLIARLIGGGFGTRVFHVELGGFDTHANQAPTHAALLSDLSRSLLAFQRDLAHQGAEDRVLSLVFSEFGRRAAENGSRGTDHGAAAPVLLVGPGARGGLVGTPPDLERLVDGDVPCTTDFRRVYAALEGDWMGCEPSTALPPLDVLS